MVRHFSRLAIVNRGEPAMRLIHAVHELDQEYGRKTTLIALFTDSERDAMFVRNADEAISLGPSIVVGVDGSRRNGYLDHARLETALLQARADAVWVGWGFVAEQPEFVELCERLGIVFIGPDPAVMRLVGDKISAKRLAEAAGIPVAPWSDGPVSTVQEALSHSERIGFPLMIKAAAGGGGRGIRRVNGVDELAGAFTSARTEALQAFGDGTLLLEKLITGARHVEVQIMADGKDAAWALGVRDCSYQRRNQKILEESSSPALTAQQERELMAAAQRLVLQAGYRNAGTVEFLYEPASQRFSFMEVNARLQVEHPVTEAVTGVDLVKLQLHIAGGGRLEGEPPAPSGHAIEARLNAEDPALGFAPAPGRLLMLRLPTGPGLRVDTGVSEGDLIPAEFDSMIGKLIAWGRDRNESLARLRRAVAETVVVVDGGTTNQGFLLELLGRPEVQSGEVDTSLLDRVYLGGSATTNRHGDIALIEAAIELADKALADDRARFFAYARRGRPQADTGRSRLLELGHRGQSYQVEVSQLAPDRYRIAVGGRELEVSRRRLGRHERRIEFGSRSHRTVTSQQGGDLLVEVDGMPHRISVDDGGIIRNLSPAVVVSLPVAVGDIVEEGDVVAVVEAMKMESSLTSPARGRIKQVFVGENVHVAAQSPLVALEPIESSAAPRPGQRLRIEVPDPEPGAADGRAALARLRWSLLGYDIGQAEATRTIAELRGLEADDSVDRIELLTGENRLLGLFADVRALSRSQLRDDDGDELLLHSPQEHLHAWLRSLDAEAEGLPHGFLAQLRTALAHYGITDLERTPQLEDACHRLFLSQQRDDVARSLVLAILDHRLEDAEHLIDLVDDAFREALDRLVVVLEGRDPVVADLAREVRFRYFDEPVIAAARDRVYSEIGLQIAALARDLEPAERDDAIDSIVQCPRPLATLLTSSMRSASPRLRPLLVEAMVRRYYRVRSLDGFEQLELDGIQAIAGSYPFEGATRRLLAAYVELGQVGAAAAAFARYAADLPAGELAVLDLFAEQPTDGLTVAALAERFGAELAELPTARALHRIVIGTAEPRRGRGMAAVDLFTFRPVPGAGGLVEDEVMRGLHPMMGHRLALWRFREFDLERLASSEDAYVFHGTARSNPKDERLFALAEVRDLTPVIDDQGRHVALPEFEQVLVQVLETIRVFQAPRPLHRRLMWNRVILHVWPVMHLDLDELRRLMARLAPSAAGLGLEMLCVHGRVADKGGAPRQRLLRFFAAGHEVSLEVDDPPTEPLHPLDEGARRVISARRRGTMHPAEIVRLLAPHNASTEQSRGEFVEHDLDELGRLIPVDRLPATNRCGIVVGTVRNYTDRYPEGMQRVILLGDPTRALGSLAEPECRRIIAAIDHAERLGVPLEWFALSAGAKIAMDSGTETMDWIAAVLRRIVLFTQAGGEINVVVAGINVGAQPYWNAEATMLMHTRGALIMTPASAMVLTGKQALDYSGGVSAEDNFGIGGYERIMGPNGEAQYWAADLAGACRVLLSYYEHTYVAPGERFPRPAPTADPADRDICDAEHVAPGSLLTRLGDVFSDTANPGRKQPFDIRSVMHAVVDSDHPPLERWPTMQAAEIAVVWDAHLGGSPVSLIGIESRPLARHGPIPADGPEQWTSGTLFPRSAKKIARAINSCAGRRPLVVLANLAGFDGSPESMRNWQLEFGAEIGRAVVNHDGPIVFCVVSRFHGGAFVVFSQKLNPQLVTIALDGTRASVIGGAPAAAVVFAREVEQAAASDPRIAELDQRIANAEGPERQQLRGGRASLWREVLAQQRREFADRFDQVHSVERAVRVGSVSATVAPQSLRRYLIDSVQQGMRSVERTRRRADHGGSRMAQPTAR